MIKKLRKKIILYTTLSVFSLLVIVLSLVNGSNFIAASREADMITDRIKKNNGQIGEPGGPGGMGPGDKDTLESIRYFTYSEETNSLIQNNTSISEENAIAMAKKVMGRSKTGWTDMIYRYRVYKKNNIRYVAIIDQGRELTPSYRVLIISAISSVVGVGLVALIMFFVSKKLIKPIEENNNRQRRFMVDAAVALKTPVSVISLDNATLTNKYGEEPANKSIRKQIDKLIDLTEDLNSLTSVDEINIDKHKVNISNLLKDVINQYHFAFSDNDKELSVNIQDDVTANIDDGMFKKLFSEVVENALKYSDKATSIALKEENGRIIIEFINDAQGIPNGSLDRVFEKFYRLDYKDHSQYDGSGLGLSIVKEIIDKHEGRVIAKGEDNHFILKIEL